MTYAKLQDTLLLQENIWSEHWKDHFITSKITRNGWQISPRVQWGHSSTPCVNLVAWKETVKLFSSSLIFQLPEGWETAQMKGEECESITQQPALGWDGPPARQAHRGQGQSVKQDQKCCDRSQTSREAACRHSLTEMCFSCRALGTMTYFL